MNGLLEDLRHELAAMHGLWASDAPFHEKAWRLDTTPLLERIDAALSGTPGGGTSLSERIEAAYDVAVGARRRMQIEQTIMADEEQSAKMDNLDEWTAAKNNDVRRSIIERELGEPGGTDGAPSLYWSARRSYIAARDEYRLALLEIERLRLLVGAADAEGKRA